MVQHRDAVWNAARQRLAVAAPAALDCALGLGQQLETMVEALREEHAEGDVPCGWAPGSDAKACFHNVSPKFSAVSVKKPNISLEALGSKLLAQVAWMRRRSIRISRQLSTRNILHRPLEVFSVGAILPSIEDSTGMVRPRDSAYVRVRVLALS
ncbi:hypothetical protein MTO96_007765 [Rhipicephalus appendiculatus]